MGYDYVLSLELGHGMGDPEGMAKENVTFLTKLLEELGIGSLKSQKKRIG